MSDLSKGSAARSAFLGGAICSCIFVICNLFLHRSTLYFMAKEVSSKGWNAIRLGYAEEIVMNPLIHGGIVGVVLGYSFWVRRSFHQENVTSSAQGISSSLVVFAYAVIYAFFGFMVSGCSYIPLLILFQGSPEHNLNLIINLFVFVICATAAGFLFGIVFGIVKLRRRSRNEHKRVKSVSRN